MLGDGMWLLLLAASTLLFQLVGMPLVFLFFGKEEMRPEWWAWGRVTGWLVTGLTLWLISFAGLPVNTLAGFWITLAAFAVLGYRDGRWRARERMRFFLRRYLREVLQQEVIFLFGFIVLGLIRTYQPQILDLEKFMNAGLMAGYLRSPTLPAQDLWLAGEAINYYSFGHFLGSLLLRFWSLPVEIGFNVLPGWVAGLTLVQAFALVRRMLQRFVRTGIRARWPLMMGGLTGALLIVFGGNSHPIWYWLTHVSFEGYWYPEAARFIEYTIHEFPAYSFVVSDVHAHFWDIPIVLLGLAVMWQWLQVLFATPAKTSRPFWKNTDLLMHSTVLGAVLGVMGMTNTWDMVVYAMMLAVLAAGAAVWSRHRLVWFVYASLPISAAALVVIAPWLFHFSSIVTGVRWVQEHSPLWQLAVLWMGHVVVTIAALLVVARIGRQKKTLTADRLWIWALGITALTCVILPEVIFFKDIYPTYPRANTMFKFTFQASIQMSLLAGWLVGWVMQRPVLYSRGTWWLLRGLLIVFCIGALAYPFISYPQFYGNFQKRFGFNGLRWLQQEAPDDLAAILWLREHTLGRPTVVEAVGESYTTFGRVSVFSGLPTLLGWRAHEWLWRGGFEIPGQRTEEVRAVYEEPLGPEAAKVLARYTVEYIFVGSKEREAYQVDVSGVRALGLVVFEQGRTFIIKRTP